MSNPRSVSLNLKEAGLQAWREVCGDQYVEQALATANAINAQRLEFVNNEVFGSTWARQVIPRPQLSLVTLALLAGAQRWDEFELHIRNALLHTQVPLGQLRELLFHINLYCGVPAGRSAMNAAFKIFDELHIDIDLINE